MANFPRTVLPRTATSLVIPGAMKQFSHAGLVQVRNTRQVGWRWSEQWGLLSVRNVNDQALMAFIQKAWNRGEIHEFTHPLTPGSGIAPNGLGTGGVLVDGASQTGDTLFTDAWPTSTSNCVRAGDVIKVGGTVYMVTADAGSDGLGQVDIPIVPPLRSSPADNAPVTTSGVTFTALITAGPQFTPSKSPQYFDGLQISIAEALS